MTTKTISALVGYSGSSRVRVYVYGEWYVIEGATCINRARNDEDLVNEVHLESIQNRESFTWDKPIESEKQLKQAVRS